MKATRSSVIKRWIDTEPIAPTPYKEGRKSIVTHLGVRYSVDKLIKVARDIEITEIPVSQLTWMFEGQAWDQHRVDRADLSVPVLVTEYEGRWVTLDGFHRAVKAFQKKKKVLPAKIISTALLTQCRVK